ncbi:tetratricopeptide repeat protein (plasmid) [Pseudoalteromonas xiamenensis]|uniref:tetratricopeptide repeat protein n=1 Tax=Pseudoalteromonas xiamenensis TaxID=882626 RepID=UPI0027E4BC0C|nr:tetratricopeptide repeat protein [Pseudoalteromonas xiamenensis]WMN61917.1 tetratricopeptide repeat protein [Pseudoalteromonas xiamenensis]
MLSGMLENIRLTTLLLSRARGVKTAAYSVLFFASTLSFATQQANPDDIRYQISRAEYFLYKAPKTAIEHIDAIAHFNGAEPELEFQANLLKAQAYLLLFKQDEAAVYLDKVFAMDKSPAFTMRLFSVLYTASTWLRRNNHHETTTKGYTCALKHASNNSQKLKALNGLANTARESSNLGVANSLYLEAKELAERLEDANALASISNNLGVVESDRGNRSNAQSFFKDAYTLFQLVPNKSGELNSGLNLLVTTLVNKDEATYARIHANVKALVNEYQSASRVAYLNWVEYGHAGLQGKKFTDSEKAFLAEEFSHLDDLGLQRMIKKYLADDLGVEVTLSEVIPEMPKVDHEWVATLVACNW